MACITYISRSFSRASIAIIERANQVVEEYLVQGFQLTLRQLYYQFVARDWLPNRQSEYKRLGSIIADARNAGLLDWDVIEDRTRSLRALAHWESPSEILRACASQFRVDLWRDQPCRVEVWIEKDALAGVFEGVCRELDVPLFSCRGYASQSELWVAGQRLAGYIGDGQQPVILHFGDHDPSGIDMTRDVAERLSLYSREDIIVKRLALNMEQVEEYSPPPNPAKATDSRFASYLEVYGDESYELDALEPSVLAGLVRAAVSQRLNAKAWKQAVKRQEEARRKLTAVADGWG